VIENVPGLESRGLELVLKPLLWRLDELGYRCDHRVVSASEFEVPQQRRRFVLVATRLQGPELRVPEPITTTELTVRAFIGDERLFPPISAGHRDVTPLRHSAAALSPRNHERLRRTPPSGGDRRAWKDVPGLQIPAYAGSDGSFRNVYGRAFWDRLAPTITTRFNSLSNGRFGHPEQDRAFSLREGATLQTFPRDYVFCGVESEVARQIGNAVPPAMARAIGRALVAHRQGLSDFTVAASA